MDKCELPSNWAWTTLGDITIIQSGAGFPEKYQGRTVGDLPFAKVSDISNAVRDDFGIIGSAVNYIDFDEAKELGAKIFPPGSVLFAKIGEAVRLNRRVIAKTDLLADNNVMGLIPIEEVIVPKLVLYFMHTIDLYDYSRATTVPSVRKSDVVEIEFPLSPLAEQQRIVDEIEAQFTRLDAVVAALKRAQATLKRYRASVLKTACEGRLIPQDPNDEPASQLLERILTERRQQWNGRGPYAEPAPPDTSDLPELSVGWVWANLTQLKTFSLYGPRYSSNEYVDEGTVVLRTSDISASGKVSLEKAPHLALSNEDFEKYKCVIGDILITRTGSLGTLAVFNDTVKAIPGAFLIQYRLAVPLATSWYIFYFLKSPIGQKHLVSGGAGVGRPNLNAPTIEGIAIPLPPLAEQQRIVEEVERRLSVMDEVGATLAANLKRAERLRQSILKRAFEGKLVPQNPADESASVLLGRIREAKRAC